MRLLPLAVGGHFAASVVIQRELNFIEAAGKIFFGNITKLEPRQCLHRFAQRAQEKLPLQSIAVSGRTVQVVAHYRKLHVISWCHRDLIGGEIERHPLRHKIFDVEIPHPRLVITGISPNMPHAGWRVGVQRPAKAVQAVFRLANHRA